MTEGWFKAILARGKIPKAGTRDIHAYPLAALFAVRLLIKGIKVGVVVLVLLVPQHIERLSMACRNATQHRCRGVKKTVQNLLN